MLVPPTLSDPREPVSVLLIGPLVEDHVSLQHILGRSNWLFRKVSTCREALAHVRQYDTAVVICERDLPDGDWRLMMSKFESLPLRPNLIVTSRLADDLLWAEVLNLGGYDVLAQPIDSAEVCRVVFLAWHEHNRRARVSAEGETAPHKTKASAAAASFPEDHFKGAKLKAR